MVQRQEGRAILRPKKIGTKAIFTGEIVLRDPDTRDRFPGKITKIAIRNDMTIVYGEENISKMRSEDFFKVFFKDDRMEYDFKWRIGGSDHDKNIEKIANLIAIHEQVEVQFGDKNNNQRGEIQFVIEFITDKQVKVASNIIQKHDAQTKFLALTNQEKVDCAYFYGANPSKYQSIGELVNVMIHPESGIIMSSNKMKQEEGSPSFLQHFLHTYEPQNATQVLESLSQKAIMTGKVSKNKTGYYYDNEFIGGEKSDVVRFFFDRQDIFQYLLKEIGQNNLVDDLELETSREEEKKFAKENKITTIGEHNKLKERASELGLVGLGNAKAETIRAKIAAKEKEKARELANA